MKHSGHLFRMRSFWTELTVSHIHEQSSVFILGRGFCGFTKKFIIVLVNPLLKRWSQMNEQNNLTKKTIINFQYKCGLNNDIQNIRKYLFVCFNEFILQLRSKWERRGKKKLTCDVTAACAVGAGTRGGAEAAAEYIAKSPASLGPLFALSFVEC